MFSNWITHQFSDFQHITYLITTSFIGVTSTFWTISCFTIGCRTNTNGPQCLVKYLLFRSSFSPDAITQLWLFARKRTEEEREKAVNRYQKSNNRVKVFLTFFSRPSTVAAQSCNLFPIWCWHVKGRTWGKRSFWFGFTVGVLNLKLRRQ